MTLNDIKDYRRNMEINKPDDVIQITTDRATADWMAADLKKRKKRTVFLYTVRCEKKTPSLGENKTHFKYFRNKSR